MSRNGPKVEIAVFHYTVSKNNTKNDEKGTSPGAPRRPLEGPFDAKNGSERGPFKSDPPRAPPGPPQDPPRTPKSHFGSKSNTKIWKPLEQSKNLKGAAVGPRRGIQ